MDICQQLLTMPGELQHLLGQFPVSRHHWEPKSWDGIAAEKFSVAGQICHLLDIEVLGYQQRFHRTLCESYPQLASLDGYQLAKQNCYRNRQPEQVLEQFAQARSDTVKLLQSLAAADYARSAHYAAYGRVTLKGLVHLLRSHDLQHLASMHWLLMRAEA